VLYGKTQLQIVHVEFFLEISKMVL